MNKIKIYIIILFVLLLQTSSLFAQSKKDTTKVINLKGADVTFEKSGVMISIQPIKTEIISSKELRKAACCNLGESFETNATVEFPFVQYINISNEWHI